MARVGVIGLGQIGSGVAVCLARAGMLSAVYDVRNNASEGMEGVPAVAASPAEVAQNCDVVIIAVADAAQTIDVLSGPQGVLTAAHPGLSVVLLATISLDDLAKIRTLTDVAKVALIDSGVVGGKHAHRNGLICLVGADEEQLAPLMSVFDGFARYVVRMGGPGAGMAGKIIYNGILHSCQRAGYEGADLAKAAGVDIHQVARVFDDSSESVGGPLLLVRWPGDPSTDPAAAKARERVRSLIIKDLDAALALGGFHGVPMPVTEFAQKTIGDLFVKTGCSDL